MMTPFHKQIRVEIANENLKLFKEDEAKFLSRIVTGDETWIHHWDPETKQNSMQWKHKDSPPP